MLNLVALISNEMHFTLFITFEVVSSSCIIFSLGWHFFLFYQSYVIMSIISVQVQRRYLYFSFFYLFFFCLFSLQNFWRFFLFSRKLSGQPSLESWICQTLKSLIFDGKFKMVCGRKNMQKWISPKAWFALPETPTGVTLGGFHTKVARRM